MFIRLACLAALLLAGLCPVQTHAEAPKPFYIGTYLYDYQMASAAEGLGRDYFDFLEEHFKILQAHGANVLHFAVSRPEQFEATLRLAEKHGISLLPQLDFVYFNPAESEDAQSEKARIAGAFLREHGGDPRVLAWSVREEIAQQDVQRLARYYEQILREAPGTKFFTLNNAIGAAQDQPAPYPTISGTDRYAFWWEFSGGGYLASPAFALDWTRQQAALYYEESARRGADFMLVTTASAMLMPQWANTLAKNPGAVPYPTVPEEQMAMQKRALAFAADGRMGWRKFSTPDGDFYNLWKYYRAPQNSVKAMAWISVLEGARLFLLWHYEPAGKPGGNLDLEGAARSDLVEIQYVTLAGRPGMANPQLEEFGEAAREIRAWEPIITRMTRTTAIPLQTDTPNIHHKSFTYPGLTGRILVLQNCNIGTWPGDSRYMFNDDDPIRIDDNGNLADFKPLTQPTDVHFTLPERAPDQQVYDLKSGHEIPDADGYHISILPGSGTLIYVGSADDAGMLHGLVR